MAVQNSADDNEMAKAVADLEKVAADRLSWQMAHVAEGKQFIERTAQILKDAKSRGISPAALKAVVKKRDYEAKAAAEREKLEDDQAHTFDMIMKSIGQLGGTPLGDAAVEKAAPKPKAGATQDAVTSAVVKAFKKPDPKKADDGSKLN